MRLKRFGFGNGLLSGLLHRFIGTLVVLLSLVGITGQAHNLDTRATSIHFGSDFLQTMATRAGLGQPLVQVGDKFWVVIKTVPGPGTETGVGGYQTFYVPPGVKVHSAAYVQQVPTSVDPRGFVEISMKGQSPIAIGDGPIGAKTDANLIGLTLPGVNGLGFNNAPVDAAGKHRGTIAGVYADTGIFYSDDSRTAFYTYKSPSSGIEPGGTEPLLKNNSGDTVGEYDAANVVAPEILGVTTLWDAYQEIGYGSAGLPEISVVDPGDQRGNAPWGLASAVAGPQSGYAWEFDYAAYKSTVGTKLAKVQAAVKIGPWKRVKYPGSQISKDQPGLISAALGYAGVDASTLGLDLNDPGTTLERQSNGTGVNAIRFAIGQLQINRQESSAVQIEIVQPISATCYRIYGDAFGGDAGGTSNGKDHIWRYFDPTVVFLEPCVQLQKLASKAVVAPGESFSYQLVFANNGTVAIPNVVLQDVLPSGISYVSAVPAPSTVASQTLTWNVGTVAPNSLVTITLNVKATGVGTLCNTLTVNSNGNLLSTADECTEVVVKPLLVKKKTVAQTSVAPGALVDYTITVDNIGTGSAGVPLVVTDYLPAGFTYASLTSATLNGASYTPTVGGTASQPTFTVGLGLQAGKQLVINFKALVGASVAPGTYCNSVELAHDGIREGPVPEACLTVGGGQIGDTVFRDWNGNGTQDAGDEGLPGVTVTLTKPDLSTVTAVTDANGKYLFTGLNAGNYTVAVPSPGASGVPTGYTLTADPDGAPLNLSYAKTLALNEQFLGADWGYQPGGTGVIGDQVFNDLNGDGIFNGFDAGINNVTLNLYEDTNGNGAIDAGDQLIKTTTTSGGLYSFTGLATGLNYIVDADEGDADLTSFFSPNAFVTTTPALRSVLNLVGTVNTADFGYRANLPSSIGDTVFKDLNSNNVYDSGVDEVLPNVTVTLYRDSNADGTADGPALATRSSDTSGQYLFTGLAPDTYLVTVDTADPELPSGLLVSIGRYIVPLPSNTSILTADFPFRPVLSKTGPATAIPGNNISYALNVNYDGNLALQNAKVCDEPPTGTTFVSADNGGVPNTNVAADLTTADYTLNTGTVDWANGWAETGDDANAATGNIFIDEANTRLSFKTKNDTIMELKRRVDLSGGVTYAKLTVVVDSNGLDNATTTKVEVEANNGGGWVSLGTFKLNTPTVASLPATFTYDLVQALGTVTATTDIRLRNNSTTANKIITFTDFRVDYVKPATAVCWDLGSVVAGSPSSATEGGTTTILGDVDAEVTDDAMVDQDNATSKFGAGNDLKVKADAKKAKQSLVRWNLSTVSGTVQSVEMKFFQLGKNTGTAAIQKNTSTWAQGTVTWNTRPGTTGISVGTVTGNTTKNHYDTNSAVGTSMVAMVQDWVTTSGNNFGITLVGASGGELDFASVEKGSGNPILTVVTGGTGNYRNALAVSPTVANVGDTITITMSLTNTTAAAVTSVAGPANLVVNNLGGAGASATKQTGPSPAGTVTVAAGGSQVFTYTYQVTGPLTAPDQLTFTGTPTSTGSKFIAATSGGTLIAPALGMTVKVNNPNSLNVLDNTGTLVSDEITVPSNPVQTALSGSIGDTVYADVDGSGTQNGSEVGIPNVRVFIDQNANGTFDVGEPNDVTDALGKYRIFGLTAATYTVIVDTTTTPAGYVPTTATSLSRTLPLASSQIDDADYGLRPPAPTPSSIGDTVWIDTNENGVVDPGEVGIANVDVRLYRDTNNNNVIDGGDQLLLTTSTDANGNYVFNGLYIDNYIVDVVETDPQFPGGLGLVTGGNPTITSPPANGVHAVDITSNGSTVTIADFGYNYTGVIGDFVWYDTNANGLQDETGCSGAPCPVPNATVVLVSDTNGNGSAEPGEPAIATYTTCDGTAEYPCSGGALPGQYQFSKLPPGNYVVQVSEQEIPLPGHGVTGKMILTTGGDRAVVLSPGSMSVLTADFGLAAGALLEGHVFHDVNHSSLLDGGDILLPNVTVNLYSATGNTILQTTTTDAAGEYRFIVAAGDYRIEYVTNDTDIPLPIRAPSGESTTPLTYTMTAVAGQEYGGFDFGRDNSGSIGDTIYADLNGDHSQTGGEPGLPSVTVELYSDLNNNNTVDGLDALLDTQITDASGHYLFVGLADGNYVVNVNTTTVPSGYNLSPTGVPTTESTAGSSTAGATVSGGGATLDRDFGYQPTAPTFSVSGNVWHDNGQGGGIAGDGFKNGGETNLPTVKVTLSVDADGAGGNPPILYTVFTDASGNYLLNGVPGTALVVITVDPTTLPNASFVQTGDPDALKDNQNTFTMASANVTGKNFGYRSVLASIAGTVVRNANGNGLAELGEIPVSGIAVTLRYAGLDGILNTGDDTTTPATTDGSGDYSFTGLIPGFYEITKVNPTGYYSLADRDGGNPDSITLTIGPGNGATGVGDNKVDQDFELSMGQISGTVYKDTNNDDVGDVGLAGVTVTLYTDPNGDGDPTDGAVYGVPTTTALNGTYSFNAIPAGTYVVVETDPSGYLSVADTDSTTDSPLLPADATNGSGTDNRIPVNLAAGETDSGNDFVDEQLGTISGTVKQDNNNDDLGDAALVGVTVTLYTDPNGDGNPADGVVYGVPTTTDGTGAYSFSGVVPGTYVVVETDPVGYQSVTDGDSTVDSPLNPVDATNGSGTDNRIPVNLAAGETDSGNDFVDEQYGAISGHVFKDTDNNNTGDAPFAGVTLTLLNSDGTVYDNSPAPGIQSLTQITDGTGSYTFNNVPPGSYRVSETQPVGYASVSDHDGGNLDVIGDVSLIVVTAGNTNANNDFVEEQTGIISGTVYADTNNDNGGDVGLDGVTVELFADTDNDGAPNGAALQTTTTAGGGLYSFSGVVPGAYVVVETDPVGYQSVADGDSTVDSPLNPADLANNSGTDNRIPVNLATGETDSGNDFVDEQLGSISGKVWADTDNDNVGNVGLDGVTVKLFADTDNNGIPDGAALQTTTTAGGGLYSFTGVAPGNYVVVETDPSGYQSVADGDATTPGDDLTNTSQTDNQIPVGITAGESDTGNDFVDEQTGTISGTVYKDTNNDNAGDLGLDGVTVELFADSDNNGIPDGAVLQTTTTAGGGLYSFTGVAPGNYVVVETDLSGYQSVADGDSTTPGDDLTNTSQTDNQIPVGITAGESDTGNDFVDEQLSGISGFVLADTNNDDTGDVGIPGVTLTLLNGDGSVYDSDPAVGIQALTATTDGAGSYSFSGIPPGSYRVSETQPAGYSSVSDKDGGNLDEVGDVTVIVLVAGVPNSGNNFVEELNSSISGTVYKDTNNDDAGDVGLDGVTVELFADTDGNGTPDGAALRTTTTAGGGLYSFNAVPPGTYVVVETDLSGYQSVADTDSTVDSPLNPADATNSSGTDNRIPVNLATGETDSGNDFVDEQLGAITGHVFKDTDNNNSGDAPLVGVTLTLLNSDGTVYDGDPGAGGVQTVTATTDGTGSYSFLNLPPGSYRVSETQPVGYASVSDHDGGNLDVIGDVTLIVVTAGDTNANNDFVEEQTGSISGTVYADTDNNNSGDTALPGVTLTLLNSDGTAYDGSPNTPGLQSVTTTTDGSGNYTFSNLPPGSYRVGETQPSGYTSVSDKDGGNLDQIGDITLIAVTAGAENTGNNFVEKQLGGISGFVLADLNNDDVGEAGIPGVTLTLLNGDGTVYDSDPAIGVQPLTTTTDGTGAYSFTGIPPGSYRVSETQPAGYTSVSDTDGGNLDVIGDVSPVVLAAGATSSGNNFVEEQPASIGDYVWLDENSNGVQDAGEAGIGNVRVELYAANGTTLLATTFTDSNGGYLFVNVAPGSYVVKVATAGTGALATGLAANPTYDFDGIGSAHTAAVTVSAGQEFVAADFGYNWSTSTEVGNNTGTGAIGDRLWVDTNGNGVQDPGEPGLGGIPVTLYWDSDGDGVIDAVKATTTTSVDGGYIFDGLPAGIYTVAVNGGTTPAGYTQTGDPDATVDNKTTAPVVLAPGDVYVNADFGYQPTGNYASIGDWVYFDANANSIQDGSDYGIAGVTVALIRDVNGNGVFDAGDGIIATTTTDASGAYLFTGVSTTDGVGTDDYLVWVNDTAHVLGGLTPTVDADTTNPTTGFVTGYGISKVANLAGTVLTQDFGYTAAGQTPTTGLIGDTIYLDQNGNGQQGPGESGLEGVTVELYDAAGTVLLATTLTDENGHYYFPGLSAGTYTVKVLTVSLPGNGTGLVNTDDPGVAGNPDTGNSQSTVVLSAGEINLAQDFGYHATVPNTIAGTVWNDPNADGLLTEPGVYGGVTVVLKDGNGNIVATTVTDGSGNYVFTGLPDGTYTVDVTDVANVLNGLWHSLGTAGLDNHSQTDVYTVAVSGGNTYPADFGYYGAPSVLSDFVWNDNGVGGGTAANGIQDGTEPGIPGVQVRLLITWPDTTQTLIQTTTDASGLYRFGNLLLDENLTGTTYRISVPILPGTASPTGNGTPETDSGDPAGTLATVLKGATNPTYDFGFSGLPPTAIRLAYLQGWSLNGRVTVEWETVTELDTAGFDLYRLGANGTWVRVNRDLIPALNLEGGGVYRLQDEDLPIPSTQSYQLVELETTGKVNTYGPFEVRVQAAATGQGVRVVKGAVEVRFLGTPDAEYEIEVTDDLQAGRWQVVGRARADAAGGMGYQETGSGPMRFYRALQR